jgi:hypothetical protein
MDSKPPNAPMPWQLTVGELRRALADCPDEAAVGLRVPPGTLSDPLIATFLNLRIRAVAPHLVTFESCGPEPQLAPSATALRAVTALGHLVLGHGATGSFGHVEFRLALVQGAPICTVTSECADLRAAAVQEVQAEAQSYITGYLKLNPSVGGLAVAILDVRLDDTRRNDLQRATRMALHKGLIDLDLPPPPLYEPPDSVADQ